MQELFWGRTDLVKDCFVQKLFDFGLLWSWTTYFGIIIVWSEVGLFKAILVRVAKRLFS